MFNPEFYPTPAWLADLMTAKLRGVTVNSVLEPQAGKGDLAEACRRRFGQRVQLECIEVEPELIAILHSKNMSVVGFDWLEYDGTPYYDAIIMNPPFSNGDEHLLKAWDFMQDGHIVCLLNAETVRNPFSARRQRLKSLIEQYGTVEYHEGAFKEAERATNVDVAIVHLTKPAVKEDDFDLWGDMAPEQDHGDTTVDSLNALVLPDKLGNMERFYNMSIKHMTEAFREIARAERYMKAGGFNLFAGYDSVMKPIMASAATNTKLAQANLVRELKKKAWEKVFNMMDFHRWLDKKQREEFMTEVARNSTIPFTAANIKGTAENVFLQRNKLFLKSLANVFELLCRYAENNRYHHEGWKTNSGYKINKKVIFPYGCTWDKIMEYFTPPRWGGMHDFYTDLDRVLCVLAGKDFSKCVTIGHALEERFEQIRKGECAETDRYCESDFFRIRFFKKGTVHLEFKDLDLLATFNKKAAEGRAEIGVDGAARAA